MDESNTNHILSRRAALRAGALGVGVVWVAPVVQMVGMTRADAASQPPASVRPPHPNQGNKGNPNKGNPNKGNNGKKNQGKGKGASQKP